jgi:hypothetical protein
MDNDQMHELIMKPLVVGGVGGVLSLALVPMDVKFLGVPAPIGLGILMAGSSFVSSMANEAVYEAVLSENESELLYSSTAPVITGAATATAAWMVLGENASGYVLGEFFLLGVASEVGGSYVHDSLLGPAMDL